MGQDRADALKTDVMAPSCTHGPLITASIGLSVPILQVLESD